MYARFVYVNCVCHCVYKSVSLHRFLYPHAIICSYWTAFRFVSVGVQGFNNHVCSRGALECLSTQGAKDMA